MTGLHAEDGPIRSAGGSGSFAAFYQRTADQTLRVALRVGGGNHPVALDATQDAYVVMYERWSQRRARSVDDNRRYVTGIAVHKVIDWFRHNGDVEFGPEFDSGIDEPGFTETLDEIAVLGAVREIIARQPPRRRAVAMLYFLQHYDCMEIAAELGMKGSSVRTHLQRLRKILAPFAHQVLDDDQPDTDQGGELR